MRRLTALMRRAWPSSTRRWPVVRGLEGIRKIVREGLQLSVTGLVLGLVGALWMGRAASSLLFRVTPADPITLVAVCVLMAGVATTACYFPARRAMKLEPVDALRRE